MFEGVHMCRKLLPTEHNYHQRFTNHAVHAYYINAQAFKGGINVLHHVHLTQKVHTSFAKVHVSFRQYSEVAFRN